jgi:hypothetical protein
MAISVTHDTVVVVADDGTSPVGSDEWNAAHTVTGAMVAVSSTDNAVVRFDSTSGQVQDSDVLVDDDGNIVPDTNDGGALGSTTLGWSDLHLAIGGTLNWADGDCLLTHYPAGTVWASGPAATDMLSVRGRFGIGAYATSTDTNVLAPGSATEEDSSDHKWIASVQEKVTLNPTFFTSGFVTSFGIGAYAAGGAGLNSFAGHNNYVMVDAANTENISAIYGSSIVMTNFADAGNVDYYSGQTIDINDYPSSPCVSAYTTFIGQDIGVSHRSTGAATSVIGSRISVTNYNASANTAGTCTNLIGVDIQAPSVVEQVNNAWGLRVENFAGLGGTTSYNIISEGTTSINVFEGTVRAGTLALSTDVLLERDAAASLAQRNATTAQAFRVYNTYTDADNYERGVFDWTTNANVLTIGTQKGTSGTARNIYIWRAGNAEPDIVVTASDVRFRGGVVSTGSAQYFTDNQLIVRSNCWIGFSDSTTSADGNPDTGSGFAKVAKGVLSIATFGGGSTPAGWMQWAGQKRVASDFDTGNSTTLANITGLSVAVAAGRTYSFVAELYTTSDVAAGVKFAIGGNATATAIIYEALVHNAGVLVAQTRATALGTEVGAVTAVTVAKCTITGTITVNAAGTLTVQMAQNVGNATGSVALRGSSFIVHDMP